VQLRVTPDSPLVLPPSKPYTEESPLLHARRSDLLCACRRSPDSATGPTLRWGRMASAASAIDGGRKVQNRRSKRLRVVETATDVQRRPADASFVSAGPTNRASDRVAFDSTTRYLVQYPNCNTPTVVWPEKSNDATLSRPVLWSDRGPSVAQLVGWAPKGGAAEFERSPVRLRRWPTLLEAFWLS
jgi:hypothetical protein